MTTAVHEKPKKAAKQKELPGMPKIEGAAREALSYISHKEDIDTKMDELERRGENVKKAMKEEGKTTLHVTSPESQKKYDFTLRRQEKLSVTKQKEGFKTK